MNPGIFKHLADILEKKSTGRKNKLGEEIFEYTPVEKNLFVNFQSKTGNMLYGRSGDSKLAKTTHKISYRYLNFPNLNEDHIIRINNQIYKIEYLDNIDNKNEIMEAFLSKDNLRGKQIANRILF